MGSWRSWRRIPGMQWKRVGAVPGSWKIRVFKHWAFVCFLMNSVIKNMQIHKIRKLLTVIVKLLKRKKKPSQIKWVNCYIMWIAQTIRTVCVCVCVCFMCTSFLWSRCLLEKEIQVTLAAQWIEWCSVTFLNLTCFESSLVLRRRHFCAPLMEEVRVWEFSLGLLAAPLQGVWEEQQ